MASYHPMTWRAISTRPSQTESLTEENEGMRGQMDAMRRVYAESEAEAYTRPLLIST